MGGMAVFETPSPPERWIARDVIRIVDPLGTAIAWVDPALAGACIGFSVREGPARPWRQIVRSDPPERIAEGGSLGLAPVLIGDAARPADASATRWLMLERDPIGVTIGSVDRRDESHVIVGCDERAVEMAVIGAQFAGFRLDLAGGDDVRWDRLGPGRLEGSDGLGRIAINHSPRLRERRLEEPTDQPLTRRVVLDATGERHPGEPLFARISALEFGV